MGLKKIVIEPLHASNLYKVCGNYDIDEEVLDNSIVIIPGKFGSNLVKEAAIEYCNIVVNAKQEEEIEDINEEKLMEWYFERQRKDS